MRNFTTDWNNGIALCSMVEAVAPGIKFSRGSSAENQAVAKAGNAYSRIDLPAKIQSKLSRNLIFGNSLVCLLWLKFLATSLRGSTIITIIVPIIMPRKVLNLHLCQSSLHQACVQSSLHLILRMPWLMPS